MEVYVFLTKIGVQHMVEYHTIDSMAMQYIQGQFNLANGAPSNIDGGPLLITLDEADVATHDRFFGNTLNLSMS
jgi:hypothetical protein